MKAILTLEVDIDDSRCPDEAEETLHENLGNLVERAMAEGLVTGYSELLVEGYQSTVRVIK